MELGNLEDTRGAFVQAKEEEARQEQGDSVVLVLRLPTGASGMHTFAAGVTVAYVKMVIEQTYELPANRTIIKLGARTLIDPLSLCDCGVQPGGKVEVDVLLP